jgi:hypothetical protein
LFAYDLPSITFHSYVMCSGFHLVIIYFCCTSKGNDVYMKSDAIIL